MQYRVGVCSSCGASFKVPGTFAADKAKCKVCGGVVDVGPVRTDEGQTKPAPPVPARSAPPKPAAPAPRATAAAVPPKREGPSMKERLLSQRAAEAAKPQGGAAAASVGASPARPAAAGKPAQPAAAPRSRAQAGSPGGQVGAGAKVTAPATQERGATGGTRRRAGKAIEEGEEGRHRGRGRKREKQNPALMLTAVGLVVVAGASLGAWFYFMGGDEGTPAPEGTAAVQAGATAAQTPSAPAAAGKGESNLAERGAASETTPQDAPPRAETPAATPPARRTRANIDPASVDLTAIETFTAPAGTSPDEWSRIQNLVATALDSESGVAGTRAQRELEGLGKPAFAAIVNAMTKIDYASEQGYRDGDIAQRMLRAISNGSNFEWRYSTDPGDVYFNKRVVESWAKVWARARTDEAYWRTFTKQTDQPQEGAGGAPKARTDDLDSLDDI